MKNEKTIYQREKLSKYLNGYLEKISSLYGNDSKEVRGLARQYIKDRRENSIEEDEKDRHYEADVLLNYKDKPLRYVERLYRRSMVVEMTTICVANCRWCLRKYYTPGSLKEEELLTIAQYCGSQKDLYEILITGGDPLMIPDRLNFFIDKLNEYAPNIKIIRIGSKLPVQDPQRINNHLLRVLKPRKNLKIELGTHINHPIEFSTEAIQALNRLKSNNITIYNQSVLLRDCNDDIDTLFELYDTCRYLGIETHYLFHCVPIKGMKHHRTTLQKGIELIRGIVSSGKISGRCKPMYTAMTDIGKITLYEGTIIDRNSSSVLLKSSYSYEERKRWNPSWQLPASAVVDNDGMLNVWYLDGQSD